LFSKSSDEKTKFRLNLFNKFKMELKEKMEEKKKKFLLKNKTMKIILKILKK
jgi:hypothetical protein